MEEHRMNAIIRSLAIAGAVAVAGGAGIAPDIAFAQAQSPADRDPTMRGAPMEPAPGMGGAATTPEQRGAPATSSEERRRPPLAAAPLPGANSFTEGQARGRLESAGMSDVTGLQKDEHGVWRGRASHNGTPTDVALDFRGNVVVGAGAAPGSLASTDRGEERNRATGAGTGAPEPATGGGRDSGAGTMPGSAPDPAMNRNRSPGSDGAATGTGREGGPAR
jgi:hypothetical protein